jgi:hypothetical protein
MTRQRRHYPPEQKVVYWFSENRKFAFGAFACIRDYKPR